jgi:hypothetical protein
VRNGNIVGEVVSGANADAAAGSHEEAVMGREQFIGAWELVGSERRDAQGNPAGEALPGYVGQIIYAADGRMSAQLMGPGRPSLPPTALGDRSAMTPELKQQAYDSFISYYGRFSVDEAAGIVTHHVIGAVSPPMVNSNQVRRFTLEDNVLTLSPPVREGVQSFLRWRRVGAG